MACRVVGRNVPNAIFHKDTQSLFTFQWNEPSKISVRRAEVKTGTELAPTVYSTSAALFLSLNESLYSVPGLILAIPPVK